jgi:hypothetical protein
VTYCPLTEGQIGGIGLIADPSFLTMNYNFNLHNALKQQWQDERRMFLESCHIKEDEVKRYQQEEYFYFDGTRIWVPDHLCNLKRYRKHLFGI